MNMYQKQFLSGLLVGIFITMAIIKIQNRGVDVNQTLQQLNGIKGQISRTFYLNGINEPTIEIRNANLLKECVIPDLMHVDDFFNLLRKKTMDCQNMVVYGGAGKKKDGKKFACQDEAFKFIPNRCVVLSFGINNEWSFDDAISREGCTVYAFDPTMKKENFDRSEKIHFFNLGLSDRKGTLKNRKDAKVDRYESIIKMLNLTDVDIDYLKMDIEGSELQFFKDVFETSPELLSRVKQIGMEIHPPHHKNMVNEDNPAIPNTFHLLWENIHKIGCLGFKLVNFELNPVHQFKRKDRVESCCYEMVWARMNT